MDCNAEVVGNESKGKGKSQEVVEEGDEIEQWSTARLRKKAEKRAEMVETGQGL